MFKFTKYFPMLARRCYQLICLGLCAYLPLGMANSYQKIPVHKLPGWYSDNQSEALAPYQASCQLILKGPKSRMKYICKQMLAQKTALKHPANMRRFITKHFDAYYLNTPTKTLVTGYYAPVLKGSSIPTPQFDEPLLMRPDNLVYQRSNGRTHYGRQTKQGIKPHFSRREIYKGALDDEDLELVWMDPIDAFFLHIQGSGFIKVGKQKPTLYMFDGKNGHPYYSIGKYFAKHDLIAEEDMSMKSIRHWLRTHPKRAMEIMALNPSYIFFKSSPNAEVKGAGNVPLSAMRSMAVDPKHVPYHALVWIHVENENTEKTLSRLVVAQDTGSAIKGLGRGDLYCGIGDSAENIASNMVAYGKMYMLSPKGLPPHRFAMRK